jgi:hypothetical protein
MKRGLIDKAKSQQWMSEREWKCIGFKREQLLPSSSSSNDTRMQQGSSSCVGEAKMPASVVFVACAVVAKEAGSQWRRLF